MMNGKLWDSFKRSIASNITKKYLLIYSIVLIIPTIIIYQVIISYANDIMEKGLMQKNEQSVEALGKQLNTEITDIILQLQLITSLNQDGTVNTEMMYLRAKQTLAKSPVISSIYYIDQSKRLLFEAPFMPKMNLAQTHYAEFEHVKFTHNYVVSGLIRNFHGENVVVVTIPIYNHMQIFQGALVAELSKEYLEDSLKSTSLSKEGFSYLLDQTGKVIASTDESEIGKDYSRQNVSQKLIQGDSGTIKESYHDEPSILSYQTLRDNWGLVLGIPEEIAFKPITKLSIGLTTSFVIIFILTICFILLGMRNILNPIVHLTEFAQRSNEERIFPLQQQTKRIHTKDELGILMQSMLEMSVTIWEKQNKLEEEERFLHDVIEGIPYALVTLDNHGMVTHVNKKFSNLIRSAPEILQGKKLATLPFAKSNPELVYMLSQTMEQAVQEKELSLSNPQGQKMIVKVVRSNLYNKQGEQIGLISVLQDITQYRLWQEQIKQSEKLASIGQITAGIAHELKNPLAVLASSSELLLEEVQASSRNELVNLLVSDIYDEVKRMGGIVTDFLSFARTRQETTSWINMESLLNRVLHLLRIKLQEANIQVVKEYNLPHVQIRAKPNQLMQVYLNLILNSIDAMSNGGILRIRIDRVSDQENTWLQVQISDTGLGIPEYDQEWLFNPFFSTKENGSGLGLTIAQDIMRDHKGEIHIHSSKGKGTTLICKFPIDIIRGEKRG